MKWVTITDDIIRLHRLVNVLVANGFNVRLSQSNLLLELPDHFNINEFSNRLPITNTFTVSGRTINITLWKN